MATVEIKKTLKNKNVELVKQTNLKPVERKNLIKMYNELYRKKEVDFGRVLSALDKKGIKPQNSYNFLTDSFSPIVSKALDDAIKKNMEALRKKEELRAKTEVMRQVEAIEDKKKMEIEKKLKRMDKATNIKIAGLDMVREKRLGEILAKERTQQKKLTKLIINKTILSKEAYWEAHKKLTAQKNKINAEKTKFQNSEYNKYLKAVIVLENERKKENNKLIETQEINNKKVQYVAKYGRFTKNIKYDNDADNLNQLMITNEVETDSIKHFASNSFFLNENASSLETYFNFLSSLLDTRGASNVVLFLQDNASGKVRHITISATYLYEFGDFEDRINDILIGDVAGSDTLTTSGNYELMMDTFDLQFNRFAGGACFVDNIIYNATHNITNIFNDCGFIAVANCLGYGDTDAGILKLKIDFNIVERDAFNTVEKILAFCVDTKIMIGIYGNGFSFAEGVNVRSILSKDRIATLYGKKKILISRLKQEHIATNDKITAGDADFVETYYELIEEHGITGNIIYDIVNSHFEYMPTLKPELKTNIYISACGMVLNADIINSFDKEQNKNIEIISSVRKVLNVDENNKNVRQVVEVATELVAFDFETVIDYTAKNRVLPYSVSWSVINLECIEDLDRWDADENIEAIDRYKSKRTFSAVGFDCVDVFIDWIIANQKNKKFVFVGFNNSNFDNYILVNRVLERDEEALRIKGILYNGSQLLNATMNGRHTFFDISRHLLGSLASCCGSFKVKSCAKKSLDHHFYQQKHDNGELLDYITDNKDLKEYNENDVLSCLVIFSRYKKALRGISGLEKYAKNLHDNITIGSLSYKRFADYWREKSIELPKLSYEQYKDVLKYKVAGRVELFGGKKYFEGEKVASYDVCSLYPYVMAINDRYYPAGEVVETDKFIDDKIGFYYCDIDQSNLKKLNLPNIYAHKTETENDWAYNGMLFDYLISSEIIKLLLEFNCDVVIKKGFYFSEKIKSCDMFRPILDMMKLKNEQDDKAKNGCSSYNPVLRETTKLLMNAVSGKVIEGLHLDNIEYIKSLEELATLQAKYGNVSVINTFGTGLMVEYKKNTLDLVEKEQRPVYLGVLIYDYAKIHMYRHSYSKIGLDKLIYTDTDATKLKVSDATEWEQYATNTTVPHFEEVEAIDPRYKTHMLYDETSKVFGSFEDEMEKINKNNGLVVFSCLQKKSWLYAVGDAKKLKFKGLNPKNILLNGDESFISIKTDKNGDVSYILRDGMEREINDFYNSSNNNLTSNAVRFFKNVYDKNASYVLCSQFRRIVKNTKRNVSINEVDKFNTATNSVAVVYLIKKVRID